MPTPTETLSLVSGLADSIASDSNVLSCAVALDDEFNDVANDISQIQIITNIPNLPSATLDYLAFQFNVDFYDPTLPMATKVQLIEQNLNFHALKGTPAIIQNLITTVVLDAQVLEWWQYNGQPYHFRVNTMTGLTDPTQLARATKLVLALKNVRSWFDGFAIVTLVNTNLYASAGILCRRFYRLPLAT